MLPWRNVASTRVVKEVSTLEFRNLLSKYKGRIKVNSHAYFRLSQMQRKVYKDDTLIMLLTEESPLLVGIQQNNNYAAFFRKKKGYLRIIFKITPQHIEIITFYLAEQVPKIK